MPFDSQQPDQLARYSRQLLLRQVGPAGQSALGEALTVVVGAGGLGGPALLYLAAAGVGRLRVVDADRVELSNLNRQVIFTDADCGRPKAQAAAERLAALNPHVAVEAVCERLSPGNVAALLADADVVLDASDNFATRFLLNDACRLLGIPLVQAAITQVAGQVATYLPDRGPCYRCFFPEPRHTGLIAGCAEEGVLGAAAGMLGCLQATEAIKVLVGDAAETLSGHMLWVDLWTMAFDKLALPQDPNCPLCGEEPTITTLAVAGGPHTDPLEASYD